MRTYWKFWLDTTVLQLFQFGSWIWPLGGQFQYWLSLPDIGSSLQHFLWLHSNPRSDVIRATGLPISASENGGWYQRCLCLATSFGTKMAALHKWYHLHAINIESNCQWYFVLYFPAYKPQNKWCRIAVCNAKFIAAPVVEVHSSFAIPKSVKTRGAVGYCTTGFGLRCKIATHWQECILSLARHGFLHFTQAEA
jgi:hypothetical protein